LKLEPSKSHKDKIKCDKIKKRSLEIKTVDAIMISMKTTLTIEDDLMQALREKAHKTGSPFKEVVNKAIRAGLENVDKPRQIKPYKCRVYSLGYPPRADVDRALSLADSLESDEIACKLSLRK